MKIGQGILSESFQNPLSQYPRGKGFEEPYPAEELKEKREHRMKFIEIWYIMIIINMYKHIS